MKHCPKCKTNKSFSEFYFYQGKPKSWCKECCKTTANSRIKERYHSDAAYRAKHIEKVKERQLLKRDERLAYYKHYNATKRKKALDTPA